MSEWKVAKYKVTRISKHFNADTLDVIKLGRYQIIAKQGSYTLGDEVVFIPEKSVLPDQYAEAFRNYLGGPDKDRVRSVRLRGELSQGVTLGLEQFPDWISEVDEDEDIAQRLGISKYVPPIPHSLSGEVTPVPDMTLFGKHDLEQFGIYQEDFVQGEEVIVTEKLHGSQGSYLLSRHGEFVVTSKGFARRKLSLKFSEKNAYWMAAKRVDLEANLRNLYGDSDHDVQVFAEVIPIQKGYHYGQDKVTIRIFDLRVDGVSVPYREAPEYFRALWAPVLYEGEFDEASLRELAKGMEQVSGQEHHIREGIAVRPKIDRYAEDGTRLMVKLLNPKYKETGEEFN